ncbi:LPXTG cell wall anchor domain-containing protein [Kitasatospora sp. NPDC057692]|uniref:LPXTG cell wall anchor domain-containing protein n=1 Tax=Kitasatospora sp. NPDC057692 TaxID=3346215 RepID=UPI0036B69DC1
MRIRSTAARSLVAVPAVAALLLSAPAAEATAGGQAAKGNNGTVKIHDSSTGEEPKNNEPKVCTFYLDSFGFDAGQDVVWMIAQMHTGGKETAVVYGDIPVDGKGHVRTVDINLPDGQYKLYWEAIELEKGKLPATPPKLNHPKQKVFKVDCGGRTPTPTATSNPPIKPTTAPSPTPSTTPSATPTPTPTKPVPATPTTAPPVTPSAPPTVTPSATPSTVPTVVPSETPSATPSATPTVTPTATPSATPTVTPPATTPPVSPSATPSAAPSTTPSTAPSITPSTEPSTTPSTAPSTSPSAAPSATGSPSPSASASPSGQAPPPSPSGPAPKPTATVPVHTAAPGTVVNPDNPLIMPTEVSVPTPIPGAALVGKDLASTGSDGSATLLVAGAGTVLLLGGAGAVVYTRRTRRSS